MHVQVLEAEPPWVAESAAGLQARLKSGVGGGTLTVKTRSS